MHSRSQANAAHERRAPCCFGLACPIKRERLRSCCIQRPIADRWFGRRLRVVCSRRHEEARMRSRSILIASACGAGLCGTLLAAAAPQLKGHDAAIARHAQIMMDEGRKTFRYDTFGSEAFWGDALQLHKAIAGEKNGGVGPGVSPKAALSVGLKVDADVLPNALKKQIAAGKVNLDDPATTIALLKLNAVVGVKG